MHPGIGKDGMPPWDRKRMVYLAGGSVTVPETPAPGPDTVPETEPPWVPKVTEPDVYARPAQAASRITIKIRRIRFIVSSSSQWS